MGQQQRLEDRAKELRQRANPALEHAEIEAVLDTISLDDLPEYIPAPIHQDQQEDRSLSQEIGGWESALDL
jgi:hypothetical protein